MSDKKTQLLEAAIDLFSKEGFWNTSTARISKHAKVATGTLFNYFPSKEALIDEVYVTLKHEAMDAMFQGPAGPDDLEALFKQVYVNYVRWGVANPVRFKLLEQLKLSDLVSQETQQRIYSELSDTKELFQSAIRDGKLVDVTVDYLTALITVNIETSVKYAVDNKLKGKALDKFCDKGFALLWKGIIP
ncbi:MAG: TetR/AcrR family transcriptional regulator [Candidatus Thiodiazotropha sp.]